MNKNLLLTLSIAILLLIMLFVTGCITYTDCIESETCTEHCRTGVDKDINMGNNVFMKASEACCCVIQNSTFLEFAKKPSSS